MVEIDHKAKEKAAIYGMPPDVHIPIAARDKNSIIKYIGNIEPVSNINPEMAFFVTTHSIPELNKKLPLWALRESEILHREKQVWVHVDYKGYRTAYIKACPEDDVKGYVLDHIMNRRVARLKGYSYLRIIKVNSDVNTSSGGVTEKYGFDYHSTDRMKKINSESEAFIEYGDIADVIKMLNKKTGGKFQDIIRDSLYLFEEK